MQVPRCQSGVTERNIKAEKGKRCNDEDAGVSSSNGTWLIYKLCQKYLDTRDHKEKKKYILTPYTSLLRSLTLIASRVTKGQRWQLRDLVFDNTWKQSPPDMLWLWVAKLAVAPVGGVRVWRQKAMLGCLLCFILTRTFFLWHLNLWWNLTAANMTAFYNMK